MCLVLPPSLLCLSLCHCFIAFLQFSAHQHSSPSVLYTYPGIGYTWLLPGTFSPTRRAVTVRIHQCHGLTSSSVSNTGGPPRRGLPLWCLLLVPGPPQEWRDNVLCSPHLLIITSSVKKKTLVSHLLLDPCVALLARHSSLFSATFPCIFFYSIYFCLCLLSFDIIFPQTLPMLIIPSIPNTFPTYPLPSPSARSNLSSHCLLN